MATAQDIGNEILFNLVEPGVNWGAQPNNDVNADYSWTSLLFHMNRGLQNWLARTGYAPLVSDKYVTLPIVAGLDYVLPLDLLALQRVEYSTGGGPFTPIPILSFDEFDNQTGLQQNVQSTGAPVMAREAFGIQPNLTMRWNPYPTQGNVEAGDMVALYYSSMGGVLVNPTDVPGIPEQFHDALAFWCLSRFWLRKRDPTYAKFWKNEYEETVNKAKALIFDTNQGHTWAFTDSDQTMDVLPDDDFVN
jgi:hypothetical protein